MTENEIMAEIKEKSGVFPSVNVRCYWRLCPPLLGVCADLLEFMWRNIGELRQWDIRLCPLLLEVNGGADTGNMS